jgi:hypothetical protein
MSHSQSSTRQLLPMRTVFAAAIVLFTVVAQMGLASASTSKARATPPTRLLLSPSAREIAQAMTPVSPQDELGQLQLSLMRRFGTSFGGVFVNSRGEFTVATDGAVPTALMSAAQSGFSTMDRRFGASIDALRAPAIAFRDTGASLAGLYRLKAAILFNPVLRADGVNGAGLDIERGRVVVFTSSRAGAAAVRADYGNKVEEIVGGTTGLDSNRYNDASPWNGGDQIVTPSGGETTCSSGFGLEDASTGATYLLTAGHCGSATWYNTTTNNPVYNSSNLIGTTVSGSVTTTNIDAQLISADSSCIVWGQKSTTNSNADRVYITGWSNPPQGASIDLEGSVSLEQSGTVDYYDVSRTVAGEKLEDLDLVSAIPELGDSGGPVVYPSIFGPLAGGTIIGWYSSGNNAWGVVQLIDSELYTYSLFTGDEIEPNVTTTGDSC